MGAGRFIALLSWLPDSPDREEGIVSEQVTGGMALITRSIKLTCCDQPMTQPTPPLSGSFAYAWGACEKCGARVTASVDDDNIVRYSRVGPSIP